MTILRCLEESVVNSRYFLTVLLFLPAVFGKIQDCAGAAPSILATPFAHFQHFFLSKLKLISNVFGETQDCAKAALSILTTPSLFSKFFLF